MFDDTGCLVCGKNVLPNSLYCSEECKVHDAGELSASASNSSGFPSSLSTSPNPSPIFGPTKSSRHAQHPACTYRSSQRSSPTSSPSLVNGDIPDLSDEDLVLYDRSALDGTFRAPRLRGSKQSMLDNSIWRGKPGVPQAIPTVEHSRHGQGSKSMPGLHYVRKPGPINSLGMLAGPSSHKLQQSHRRFGSDAQMQYVLPLNASGGYTTDLTYLNSQDQDSSNSGLSSTPKSKNAFRISPSSKSGIAGHPSDATPGSGHSTRRVSSGASLEPRHVSDSQVETRRQLSQNQLFRDHASSPAAAATPHLSISQPHDVLSGAARGTTISKKQSASALSTLRGLAKVHGVSQSSRQQSQTTHTEFTRSDTKSETDRPSATTVRLSNLWPKLSSATAAASRQGIAGPPHAIDGRVSPMTSRRKNDHVRTRESHTRVQRSISPTGDEYSGDDRGAQYWRGARFYEYTNEVDPSGQQETRRGRSRQR